jgi:hypothetical protein
MSDARRVAEDTPSARDRAVDVVRLAAMVVVMFGHCALLLATIDTDGLRIGNVLGELPTIAPITWIVQVMPLFFLARGAAGAYGWHTGTPWLVAVHPGRSDVQACVHDACGVVHRSTRGTRDPRPWNSYDSGSSSSGLGMLLAVGLTINKWRQNLVR